MEIEIPEEQQQILDFIAGQVGRRIKKDELGSPTQKIVAATGQDPKMVSSRVRSLVDKGLLIRKAAGKTNTGELYAPENPHIRAVRRNNIKRPRAYRELAASIERAATLNRRLNASIDLSLKIKVELDRELAHGAELMHQAQQSVQDHVAELMTIAPLDT